MSRASFLSHGSRRFMSRAPFLLAWLLVGLLPACLGAPDPLPERPVAQAGIDRFVPFGAPVTLSAAQSTPGSGSSLTFRWYFSRLPDGSQLSDAAFAPNDSADAVETRFTPDRAGRYVIGLLVNDGVVDSVGDFVVVDVEGGPPAPVADAGQDQVVTQGMAVYFDGSKSYHPRGEDLYYHWQLAGIPSLSQITAKDLQNPYTPFPSLIVDTGGVFTLSLVVGDGVVESTPDYVFVTVESLNVTPIADAGPDGTIEACTEITLDGSGSYDIDLDPLSYTWSVLLSPLHSRVTTQSLDDPTTPSTRLYVDKVGGYVLQLLVSDGAASSLPDVTSLTALPREINNPPIVRAGEDVALTGKVICTGTGPSTYCPDCPALTVTLSGEGSLDPDGDEMQYLWSVTQGNATVQDPLRLTTTADLRGASTTVGTTKTTEYLLTLTATDCPGAAVSDTVSITYACTGTN